MGALQQPHRSREFVPLRQLAQLLLPGGIRDRRRARRQPRQPSEPGEQHGDKEVRCRPARPSRAPQQRSTPPVGSRLHTRRTPHPGRRERRGRAVTARANGAGTVTGTGNDGSSGCSAGSTSAQAVADASTQWRIAADRREGAGCDERDAGHD